MSLEDMHYNSLRHPYLQSSLPSPYDFLHLNPPCHCLFYHHYHYHLLQLWIVLLSHPWARGPLCHNYQHRRLCVAASTEREPVDSLWAGCIGDTGTRQNIGCITMTPTVLLKYSAKTGIVPCLLLCCACCKLPPLCECWRTDRDQCISTKYGYIVINASPIQYWQILPTTLSWIHHCCVQKLGSPVLLWDKHNLKMYDKEQGW